MKRNPHSEQRLHPRIDHCLPISLSADGYDFTTSTHNVSCVGAYCHIEKYVPPFTKVNIKLSLPINREKKVKQCSVDCKGVIVRATDGATGGFNVAIFFNQISEAKKKIIAEYVSQFLPQHASA